MRLALSSDRLSNGYRRRQADIMTTPLHNVVSAPRFALSVDGQNIKNLQVLEIKEIWSQLASHEYITAGGAQPTKLTYSKQYGQPKNTEIKATVTFDPDSFPYIWSWHQAAKVGMDGARTTAELAIYKPDGSSAAMYTMEGAWLSRVDVNIPKAGGTETASIGLTIVCDDFIVPQAPLNA